MMLIRRISFWRRYSGQWCRSSSSRLWTRSWSGPTTRCTVSRPECSHRTSTRPCTCRTRCVREQSGEYNIDNDKLFYSVSQICAAKNRNIQNDERKAPFTVWKVSSDDLELTRYKSTVNAICVGLANLANYSNQWSDATLIRRKLHCERGKLFSSMLGGAAYASVSRDFRSVLHLCSIREFMVCVDRAWF